MVFISREEAGEIMTAEERGRMFEPIGGLTPGIIQRIWYDDEGTECLDIQQTEQPGRLITSRGSVREDLLRNRAARVHGVSESDITLWRDPTP